MPMDNLAILLALAVAKYAAAADVCYVTNYSDIPAAVAGCTAITLDGITVPGKSTIDLSDLKDGAQVTFKGKTFWQYGGDGDYPMIHAQGNNIEITAAPGAVLDGNGAAWWDGLGSNGGVAKPNHFFELNHITGKSKVHGLYIKNYPVHCIMITRCDGLEVYDITLNNTDGYAPNSRSNGLKAAHNSDGFGISNSQNVKVHNSVVINQDDCVAVTSGDNLQIESLKCSGSHGLSIGSIGGKSNNNVTNVSFTNSIVKDSTNGIRIKTNSGTTGYISGILFQNIHVENIENYGIDIQQDYLNGGPTGQPTNGVLIQDVTIKDVTGTAGPLALNYYILCGSGSCKNININEVKITGGGNKSSCNFKTTGNFDCDGGFH